ncbi:hypothetical protein NDA12_005593 [Ustilago hordei]|nr:hypothetical protein NDA15_004670 [Ustilago hordei]KAJ1581930.1 hypothetical protein NDA12_005593 [Ustilago hordei]
MYRSQPLYDNGGPACMEPAIILAQLAEEDGAFDHGISIASVMETADPEYFKNVDEFLPIPIKAEAKDRFVLRAIESASSSGRGTTSVAMAQHQSATSTSTLLAADNNSPTSGSHWVVSELAPWTTKMSNFATKKIALAAGMPEYTMYTLRRMTIQTLDCTSVTEGAKRLSVGHSLASSQIVKSYLSRRNVVDIQGLVQRGKESKNRIMLHGLRRVKAITDTPTSLHAVGIAGVESMPIIQRLVRECNQAKVALSDASAQGLPAHEYQALKVDHNKKLMRLACTQSQLRLRTMIEHAYKEKEDLNLCALRGSLFGAGPAAAARELSQHLQAGGDTNDNDSSDQAGSSTMHQARTSCVPLGSHLDSHTSDQGNADPSYEWMHQAASIPFLSQAPLSFASTSTPLSSTADDLAHTSSPASGTSSPASDTSLSAEEPMALVLRDKLDGLCNQIGSMIGDLPQPDYDLLKKDDAGVPLRELFAAMTTNNVGTQNAVLATLEKQNGKSCCWCHQPFRSLRSRSYKDSLKLVTRGMMIDHMWSCAKPHMYSKYKEACCEALACQLCWHEACRGQILPQDHQELVHHIMRHYKRIKDALDRLAYVPNRSYRCPFAINSGDEQCQWAVHWQERKPSSLFDLMQHLETAHGFPTITSDMTKYCAWHDKWTFGHEQTNGHFEMHIDALLRGYAEQVGRRRTCWFCLVDEGLPAATRANYFKDPSDLVGHVCTVHIYPDRSPVHHCPFCNKQIPTYDFTDHLREHDLVLGAKSLLHRPDLIGTASRDHESRENWISWVQSITPSPPPPAAMSSIQSAAQEEINASMAQAVTDAEEQVAGQVGRSVLPISSTGATQEASSANSSRPKLSACRLGYWGRPLLPRHACPFCAQDESLPAEQRSRVWVFRSLAHHVAGLHLFNMSSSPTTCPSCGEVMPIKELTLHLDRRHELGLSGLRSEPLADDLSNLGGRSQAKRRPAFLRWIEQGYPNNNTSGRVSAKAVAVSKRRSGSSRHHAVSTPSAPGQQQSGTSQTDSSNTAIASGSESYPEIDPSVLLDDNFYEPPTRRVRQRLASDSEEQTA